MKRALFALSLILAVDAQAATAAIPSTANAAAVASLGMCVSENAPGTPKGAECRCSASGKGAWCNTNPSGFVACGTKTGGVVDDVIEMCSWTAAAGCTCLDVVFRIPRPIE